MNTYPARWRGAGVAAAVGPVPAAVGDRGELVDVDVHQLARCFSHIALGLLGGAVAGVEASHALGVEDLLHRGGGQADLRGDAGRAPAPPPAQIKHLGAFRVAGTARAAARSMSPASPSAR